MKNNNALRNMLIGIVILAVLLAAPIPSNGAVVHAQEDSATPSLEATLPPTEEPTSIPTLVPTDSATEEPTLTSTPTATEESTSTETPTGATTPTETPTVTPTGSPTSTSTMGPTSRPFDLSDINNHYIVVYKDNVNFTAKVSRWNTAITAMGGKMMFTFSKVLHGFAAAIPPEALDQIKQDPDVDYIEPDQIITLDNIELPSLTYTDTQSSPDWGLDRIDQQLLPLDNLYHYDYTGNWVNVYVVDTGIRTSHTEFGGRASMDFDAVGDGYGTDCNGHGTHVSGTIGGATYGVAKNTRLHGIRVLNCEGSGTTSTIIAGIEWVTTHHADPAVVNMSLGGNGTDTAMETAINNSISAGITYVVAAGNSADNACNYFPARIPAAITVAATDDTDTMAYFSNYGSCVDIFAPGVDILSAYGTGDSDTAVLSGTSMAAPHVTGAVALYLQEYPSATPAQVASALINNSTKNVVIYPNGSPNRMLYTYNIPVAPALSAPAAGYQTTNTTPTLTWNTVPDGLTYELQYSTSSSFASGNVNVPGLGTSYTFGSPLADGHYYWRVRAVNVNAAAGAWSASRDFTVDTTGPAAPTLSSPADAATLRGTTAFSWTAPATAAGYEFVYDNDADFSSPLIDNSALTATSFTVTNPGRGSYYWRVRARDALGNWGAWSAARTFTVKAPIPATPTLSSPAAGYQTTNTTPALSWTTALNGDTYELQYSTSSSFASGNVNVPGLGTSYTFGSPLADGHYYWRVRAVNLDSEPGSWSASRDFTVDTTGPAAPTLSAPADAATLIGTTAFSWTAPATAAGYEFVYDNDADFGSPVADNSALTATSFTVTNPALGSYYWRVRAKDALGNWGAWSAARTFTVTAPIPAAPALSSPAAGFQTTNTMPTLNWNTVPYGDTYELQYSTSSSFASGNVNVPGLGTSYTFGSPLADGHYYWRVRAVNVNAAAGAWSASRDFTVDTTGPAAPTLSSPADAATLRGTTAFSWTAPATAAGYEFVYDNDADFSSPLIDNSALTATSFTVTNPGRGSYYWRVRARDALGNWGAWSAARTFTVKAPIPATPTLSSPAAGYQTTNTTPALSWTTALNGDTYELQYSTSSSFASGNVNVPGLGTSYTFGSPLADGHYYWRVRAVNLDSEPGSWSASRDFTVDTTGPAAPTLSAPADAATLIGTTAFSWTAPATAAGYEFVYDNDADFGSPVADNSALTATSFTVTNPALGSYYWRVRAKDALGNWGAWSAARTFTVTAPIPAAPALSSPAAGFQTTNTMPTLNWNTVPYGDTYELQYSTSSSFASGNVNVPGLGTSYTFGSPLADGHYYWRVRAVNVNAAAGAWSASRDFTVDTTGPAAPTLSSPADAATLRGTTAFSWTAPATAAGYEFVYDNDADFSSPLIDNSALTATSFTVTNPGRGSYYWRVRARDALGNWGAWSAARTFTVKAPIPATPTLSSPAAGYQTTNTTPALSWTTALNGDTYELQYSTSSSFASGNVNVPGLGTSYTFGSPLADGHYYWRVRAVNLDSEPGSWSSSRDFTVDTTGPAAPALSAPAVDATVVGTPSFTWTAPATATGYEWQANPTNDFSAPAYTSPVLTATSYTPATLPQGDLYWEVRAKDALGNWGPWSSARHVYVQAAVPAAPALSSPAAGFQTTNTMPTLNWNTVPYGNTYELQYSTSSSFASGNVNVPGLGTSYTFGSPLADGHYYWRVRAVNVNAAAGAWSASRDFTVDTAGPVAPALSSPADAATLRGTTAFSWTAPATAAGYEFVYDNDADFSSPVIDNSALTATSFTVTNPARGSYYWRVRAKDALGNWGAWSAARTFVINAPIPATPGLSSPAAGFQTTNATPTLTWTTAFNGNTYELQYSTSSSFASYVNVNGLGTNYTFGSPLSDGHYYWRVRAANLDSESGPWSAIRDFTVDTTGPAAPALSAPADAATLRGTTAFSWTAPATAAGYEFVYDNDADFGSPLVDNSALTATSFTVTNPARGSYYWRVRAKDALGNWGPWSAPRTFTVKALIPATPVLNAPATGSMTESDVLQVFWLTTANASTYEIQLSTSSAFSTLGDHGTSGTLNYTTSTLAFGNWYWRVRGVNLDGEPGSWSASRYFTIYPSFNEEFNGDLSNWLPSSLTYWQINSGVLNLLGDGGCGGVDNCYADYSNVYNGAITDFTDFTFRARMKRDLHEDTAFNICTWGYPEYLCYIAPDQGIFVRATVDSYGWPINGYYFASYTEIIYDSYYGYYYEELGYNIYKITNGYWTWLGPSSLNGDIFGNYNFDNLYNVDRVTAIGNKLYFYINNTLVYTLTDSSYTHGKVGILAGSEFGNYGDQTLYIDYARLGMPVTSPISGESADPSLKTIKFSDLPSAVQKNFIAIQNKVISSRK